MMSISASNTAYLNPFRTGSGVPESDVDPTWRMTFYYPPTTCPCGWSPRSKRRTRAGAIRALRRHITSAHSEHADDRSAS